MEKDLNKISLLLDFLSKNRREESVKKFLEKRSWFYLLRCEEFDRKSLLEYIDAQGSRATRQKEELIDLAIKMAKIKSEEKMIKKFKTVIDVARGEEKELESKTLADLIIEYTGCFTQ